MATPTNDGSTLALLLSGSAHDLRNHVATLRSVVQLQEDPEVADALAASTRALQVTVERAVTLARIELGRAGASEPLALAELVALAMRRARREGAAIESTEHAFDDVVVAVPGTVAERLVTDVLHYAGPTPSIVATVHAGEADIAIALHAGGVPPGLAAVLIVLAHACGGRLDLVEDEALLTLQLG
ncbi:MAG: hypothetical protein JWL76_670 [Thermoleophilia bacterium]|nr:hypothetical protein [Thermoleophilia bacterium]